MKYEYDVKGVKKKGLKNIYIRPAVCRRNGQTKYKKATGRLFKKTLQGKPQTR